jgi:hypothetical protein
LTRSQGWEGVCYDIPTWSSSIKKYFAPFSFSNALEALQYGQYDLEKTTTLFSSMIFCALVLAADMVAGVTLEEPRRRRRKDAMVAVFFGESLLA